MTSSYRRQGSVLDTPEIFKDFSVFSFVFNYLVVFQRYACIQHYRSSRYIILIYFVVVLQQSVGVIKLADYN